MIGLVGCSGEKLSRLAQARELYSSPLFRAALAYAEARCDRVYVLSALWGLVELDAWLVPYDRRLGRKKEREAWGRRAASRLIDRHGREVDYLLLAGADYAAPLATALLTCDGHHEDGWRGVPRERIHQPLQRLRVGERLRWLNEQIAQLPPRPSRLLRPWREVLGVAGLDEVGVGDPEELEDALHDRHRDAVHELGVALIEGLAELRRERASAESEAGR